MTNSNCPWTNKLHSGSRGLKMYLQSCVTLCTIWNWLTSCCVAVGLLEFQLCIETWRGDYAQVHVMKKLSFLQRKANLWILIHSLSHLAYFSITPGLLLSNITRLSFPLAGIHELTDLALASFQFFLVFTCW